MGSGIVVFLENCLCTIIQFFSFQRNAGQRIKDFCTEGNFEVLPVMNGFDMNKFYSGVAPLEITDSNEQLEQIFFR